MVRLNGTPVAAAIALIATAGFFTACESSGSPLIAREIHGAWITESPSYSDRAFVVTPDSFYLHQGGGIVAGHRIRSVRRVPRPDHVAYTITYEGIVESVDFRFEYHARDSVPFIHVRNQPRIQWRRGDVPAVQRVDGGIVAAPETP